MKYKYSIGTRIKYKGCVPQDVGKEGRIVGHVDEFRVWIVIPESYVAGTIYGDSEHRWCTDIGSLEILAVKKEQLLFDFMLK